MDRLLDTYFNLGILARAWPGLLAGLLVTLEVAVCTVIAGLAAGFGLALLRLLRLRALNFAIAAWVDIFRALPQLVVIVYVYFALPYAGLTISPFAATVLALGAVLSAFAAESITAAIAAVPPGQWDAARALGLHPLILLHKVVLPQALRLAAPLLTNRAIAIVKGTALGTAVSLPELLGEAQSTTAILANPSPLMLAAVLYLVLFLPLVIVTRGLEHRMNRGFA